ncbi:hypothetical protein COLO4_18499 [Corchorus olitorius]|uniref:Uncharacterized protein n=1 Tax=Corchorus olitorius TaxID=93759 RepID=A0A1R3J8T8_9ROSI|nr:hypothetical protein COLO4_18499 [Corchorus olitorius]
MAQQEEGWPLGLQPLNVRVGLATRNPHNNYSGSISFNTVLTGSPSSSTDSSSDLDTESTGSFFHDKSITLGSLIGVSSILELSKRSDTTDADQHNVIANNNVPSLGHFLAVERRAASEYRRNLSPNTIYGPDHELALAQTNYESNSLFVNGHVAPPQSSSCHNADAESRKNGGLDNAGDYGHGVPVLLSCMCGQPST